MRRRSFSSTVLTTGVRLRFPVKNILDDVRDGVSVPDVDKVTHVIGERRKGVVT